MTVKREKVSMVYGTKDTYFENNSQIYLQSNNNTINDNCQDDTIFNNKEIKVKFIPKKTESIKLSESYKRLKMYSKSERVFYCGTYLEFVNEIDNNGIINENGKLNNANFCRDRLCPMCSWRRSYKIFSQLSKIMDYISDKYTYLFLTLTIPNVNPDEYKNSLDKLNKGFVSFTNKVQLKKVVKGIFKVFETTINENTGMYHPHIHCVLAVNKNYLKSRDYIKRDELLKLWKKSMNNENISQLDIRVAKDKNKSRNNISSAIAEIAKYSVKPGDYIKSNIDITDKNVLCLSNALENKKLCSFSGCFSTARKNLKLDDCENGDLIHINEKLNSSIAYMIIKYGWTSGIYKIINTEIKYKEVK